MFRDVVGPEREEVKGSWKSVRSEELHALYFSPFVKEDQMGRMCCTSEKKEEHLLFFFGTREGTRLLGSRRHRWEDNIKIGLR